MNYIKKNKCVQKVCTQRLNSYSIEEETETELKETTNDQGSKK